MSKVARPSIDRFAGEYHYLSNFYVESDGSFVEREFQAAKATDPYIQNIILSQVKPAVAKKNGSKVICIRPDWHDVRIGYMRLYVLGKFLFNPELAAKLKRTGNYKIVDGNHWGDRFWGVCGGHGSNWLGRILMEVRDFLREMDGDDEDTF